MFRMQCEPIPERGTYRVSQSIIVEGVLLPAGFEFDGASIPAFLWPIIGSPFDPRFMVPAAVHDRVYETGELPREEADYLFRKLLRHNNVDEDLAETMHTGVDWFGASHYNNGGESDVV